MAVDESNIVKKITLGNVDINTETFNDQTKDIGADANNIILYKDNANNYTNEITENKESLTDFAQNHSRIKNGEGVGSTIENLVAIDSDVPEAINIASGEYSHAGGYRTTASGEYSHAEGYQTTASGWISHAEGTDTLASGMHAHAQNNSTTANGFSQTVIGKFNVTQGDPMSISETDYALIIGNGQDEDHKSNALAVRWDGAIVLANGTVLSPDQFLPLLQLSSIKYETVERSFTFRDPAGTRERIPFIINVPEGIAHRRILGFNIRETSMTNCKIEKVEVSEYLEDIPCLYIEIQSTANTASFVINADIVYIEW